jgi:murein L,D-transpeptidase YafK
MGDQAISEIYTTVREALRNGQDAVSVQALPFRLDPENLARNSQSPFFLTGSRWAKPTTHSNALDYPHRST